MFYYIAMGIFVAAFSAAVAVGVGYGAGAVFFLVGEMIVAAVATSPQRL